MKRKRILVVDDDVTATRLVKLGLEQTGAYEVCEAHAPATVLATARRFQPHLIVLDVVMPGLDGGDLAAQLKQDAQLRSVPIVFLTSLVSEAEVAESPLRTAGCRVMAKPINIDRLSACIETELAGAGSTTVVP